MRAPPHAPFWTPALRANALSALTELRARPNWREDESAMQAGAAALQAASGRACGDCTLCCKLVAVKEIAKLQGHWCGHCDPKAGCRIYAERPSACRAFLCGWAAGEGPPEMKPSVSHCVFDYDLDSSEPMVRVHVDPHYPEAWREGAVRDHIRLHHALDHTVIILIQNKQRPCPSIGIPGIRQGPGEIRDPATGETWCHIRLENLP